MEDILDLYCLPYDPNIPLVCMDEQPRQLIKETRRALPAMPGRPRRVDYESVGCKFDSCWAHFSFALIPRKLRLSSPSSPKPLTVLCTQFVSR